MGPFVRSFAGEVAASLLLGVVEGVVVAGILGGVLTWGYTQTVKVEIDNIKSSIQEIKADVKCAKTDMEVVKHDLSVHKAETKSATDDDLSLQEIARELRRLKKG